MEPAPPFRDPSKVSSGASQAGVGEGGAFESPWVQLSSVPAQLFVFQKMVARVDPAARPGDLVQLYDRHGVLLGRGLYNPNSVMMVRILAPARTPIDDAFWRDRFGRAIELRRRLGLDAVTDAYRVLHAEGDELSGLVIDRYADVLACELFSAGMHRRVLELLPRLVESLGPPSALDRPAGDAWRCVVRFDLRSARLEGMAPVPPTVWRVAQDRAPESIEPNSLGRLIIREHGVRYRVDPLGGHKTGFFCDQRDNRLRLAGWCRDADVLDVCCYGGGFGLCARVLGAAREVTCVDLDPDAVALAKENAHLNQARVQAVEADAFVYLRQMISNGRKFDVVILDPPKFAPSRSELDDAMAKYHDLNRLGMQVVRPGGLMLTCSCSGLVTRHAFRTVVSQAAVSGGRTLQFIEETGASGDHPALAQAPQSTYLKALWTRVLR